MCGHSGRISRSLPRFGTPWGEVIQNGSGQTCSGIWEMLLNGFTLSHRGHIKEKFCVEALSEAIHKSGPPEIMNTDSQTIDISSRMVCLKL